MAPRQRGDGRSQAADDGRLAEQQHQVFRAGVGPASAPKLGRHWLADLNLNPRYRGAAGYGEVVRKNQEEYVDACWDQIGDILTAEMKFNLTRLAIEALGALKRKHYDVLPPERLLQLFGPALPRIEALGTATQTYRINGKIASLGGQVARSSMPVAMVDPAMRRVASPANRSLRMAARLHRATAALPATLSSYVVTMARATQRPSAFAVNAFTPDGIVNTSLFEGIDLRGAADTTPLDLSAIGLGRGLFTAGEVKQALTRGRVAESLLAAGGVPELTIREGQQRGVFTDMHVERFGVLASASPTVRTSDWGIVASQIESLGQRGVEGFLVESDTSGALLQVNALRLDSRSGQFTVDRVVAQFDARRRALSLTPAAGSTRTDAIAALAGVRVGSVDIGPARTFNASGLFAALPPNALTTAAGGTAQKFTLTPSLEFEPLPGPGGVPPVVSITMPPAIRTRTVLNRFAKATRGVQGTWRDAFAGALDRAAEDHRARRGRQRAAVRRHPPRRALSGCHGRES